MALDRLFVSIAFGWLVFGMLFGIYLGITDQLNLSNTHAHIGLLGFVLSCLFGLLHKSWPSLRTSRFAKPQLWIYEIGVLILVYGKYQIDTSGTSPVVAPGSLIVVAGTLLMVWIFATKSAE